MDNVTQVYSVLQPTDLPKTQDYRVESSEFPLWWLEKAKRNIEGLQEIAAHLHTKTAAGRVSRSGFVGDASEMDKQIIRSLSDLEQQTYAITDVLQSTLQILAEEHWRRTHKLERLFVWVRETSKKVERKLASNAFYRILAIA